MTGRESQHNSITRVEILPVKRNCSLEIIATIAGGCLKDLFEQNFFQTAVICTLRRVYLCYSFYFDGALQRAIVRGDKNFPTETNGVLVERKHWGKMSNILCLSRDKNALFEG